MYYPVLRGKQYELLLLRENAERISQHRAMPIIEPVKGEMRGLERATSVLMKNNAQFSVITNPIVGELRKDTELLDRFILEKLSSYDKFYPAKRVDSETRRQDIEDFVGSERGMIFHSGQVKESESIETINKSKHLTHTFMEEQCGKLYRKKFSDASARVLLRDGFIQRRNADFPEQEHFSDLHATYADLEGMKGFGDYLTVGGPYMEGGGPAYVVAIHITYLDADDDMQICHFTSETDSDSPIDPGRKFLEALGKLIRAIDNQKYPIPETSGIEAFRALYSKQHYPGLGHLKKLSMQHHLELILGFLEERK